MKTERGYACDCCGAELVRDIELDALGSVFWANEAEHVCLMCCFVSGADALALRASDSGKQAKRSPSHECAEGEERVAARSANSSLTALERARLLTLRDSA
ncbi:hypothetical protein [Phytopseudomonas flavescens]|uniref:hypothetical protein n=1 Tax=Phytopseudomonas flavescens TaxID=29435 RepID=UPI00111370B7|nr:hypothetical protein [Pseudomonas flavescens]